MKKRICLLFVALVLTAGCARTAKIKYPLARETLQTEIAQPKPFFTVGERFTYGVAWKGIPVGTATTTIEELTTFKGYEIYKIVVRARTNEFLSKLWKVDDTFISYMDKEKLTSRHYEAYQREGRYKKDLVVDYDFEKSLAYYNNKRDGSLKICSIEKDVQDPVSAAYYFRTIPVAVGDRIKITITLNEKNYEIFGTIDKRASIALPELGTYDAFLLDPYVKRGGKRLRKASAWGYLSADDKRIPLYVMVKVLAIPWVGEVSATLTGVEYLPQNSNDLPPPKSRKPSP